MRKEIFPVVVGHVTDDIHENCWQECCENKAQQSPLYHNLDKKQHELLAFSSGIDLHSNQATSLSSELCIPDVVLCEVNGTFVFKHIWHQGNKILGEPIICRIKSYKQDK